jgi:FkbM family methyltransferase
VVTRLVDRGYDVMYHGFQTMGHLHTIDGKIKMLDCGGPEYGMNVLGRYFEQYERDILITLYDLWAYFGKIEKVNAAWIPYFPIDAEPVSIPLSDPLRYAYKRICFSKFAEKELKKVNLGADIIYHGVDTKVYKPLTDEEKKAIREKTGIPEGTFMVGSNGANTWDRKDFPRIIRIFSEFVKKNNAKDALLYLHANPDGLEGKAYSLPELAKLYGIEEQVRYAHQKNQLLDSGLAKMYNSLDVYLSASRAEGCGLPILEAQACGVPAIVPNNSAQPEWVEGHGWVVPCSDHIVTLTTPLHNKWYLMDIDKAVEALTEAYQNKELRLKYGREAREAMLQYDWDKIVDEQWIPFLNKIQAEMETGIIQQEAEGKIWNLRMNKIDRPVLYEVVVFKGYSKDLHLTKEDRWLDIGGHIGTFSIDIADKVGMVVTFEPEPDNYEILQKNIADNKIQNITTYNEAVVGNEDQEREFHLDEKRNTGGHSFIAADGAKTMKVKCHNINDILKTYNINKVKLDCEGAEFEIIKAMDLTNIDEMIMEYHFNLLGLTKFEELVALLSQKFAVVQTDKVINPFGQGKIYCGSSKIKNKGREEQKIIN